MFTLKIFVRLFHPNFFLKNKKPEKIIFLVLKKYFFYSQVEFIVMGGTFMSLDEEYRDYFIRNLHDALSGHQSHSVQEAILYSEQVCHTNPEFSNAFFT